MRLTLFGSLGFTYSDNMSMNNLKRYIPKTLLLGILLYAIIGLLVGIVAMRDIASEDFATGKLCTTLHDCFSNSAYIVPAVMVIWPIFAFSQPLVIPAIVVLLGVMIWIMNRKKQPTKRQHTEPTG